jgi:hypothetical protein
MKKYVRDILNDLKQPKSTRDFIPPVPQSTTDGKTLDLNPPQEPPEPGDLENQELSNDPAIRVEQLDQQAQDDEERETLA